jgi:hypothetical protein
MASTGSVSGRELLNESTDAMNNNVPNPLIWFVLYKMEDFAQWYSLSSVGCCCLPS